MRSRRAESPPPAHCAVGEADQHCQRIPLNVEIVDFKSDLEANFAVQPEQGRARTTGQSVEARAHDFRLGVTSLEIPVTVTLRTQRAKPTTHVLTFAAGGPAPTNRRLLRRIP